MVVDKNFCRNVYYGSFYKVQISGAKFSFFYSYNNKRVSYSLAFTSILITSGGCHRNSRCGNNPESCVI